MVQSEGGKGLVRWLIISNASFSIPVDVIEDAQDGKEQVDEVKVE